ncbi:Uncharacterised protein [Mycobacterium tuberculosis]|nr:Uncharacterised protein [Mycobacterium tuberculosis]
MPTVPSALRYPSKVNPSNGAWVSGTSVDNGKLSSGGAVGIRS